MILFSEGCAHEYRKHFRDTEKRPSFLKGLFFIGLLFVISAALTALALTRRSAEGPLVVTEAPEALSVRVEPFELSDTLILDETFSGLITARRTSQLGFSSGGRVSDIFVDVGDRVAKGKLLARLDTRDLQANLAAAEASISEAMANFSLAEATATRQRTLLERGHVAQQRVDEANAQVDAASARIEAARAQADTIRVAIDLAVITAPYAGTITNRLLDEGAVAAPGAPILELVETGELEARIGLPASIAAELSPGETYTLVSDRGNIAATLRTLTGVIDQNLRTIMTVFDIVEPETADAGAVVRLAVERDLEENGGWVPISALAESNRGLWSIYVLEPEGDDWTIRPRLVEIVHSGSTRAFVRGTVRDGEQYVMDGLSRLVPGMSVQPIQGASAAQPGARGG